MDLKTSHYRCPVCSKTQTTVFYRLKDVPVHSVLLIPNQKEALHYPRGNINLAFCQNCGFIFNADFNENLQEFGSLYEGTQAFSSTFDSFHKNLAQSLIDRYKLHHKKIIEIGCGQGEFLSLLCEMGKNEGIGFDPAYRPEQNEPAKNPHIIKDFYSEKYTHYQADFICCKMTLEHISNLIELINTLHQAVADEKDTLLFFQVPDVLRILQDLAFWDIYYEHCSYFSSGSLVRLFQKCGFKVIDLWKAYNNQYLMITVSPVHKGKKKLKTEGESPQELYSMVQYFAQNCPKKWAYWQEKLQKNKHDGDKVVIWGAGSKAVSFLTTLKIQEEIAYTVDINPHKWQMYLPGTGHSIMAPDFLSQETPDFVLVMNPIYTKEIQKHLKKLNINARVIPVE